MVERDISRALRIIKDGGVVAVPTDTVYGLAADPRNARAVEAVYRIKQRGRDLALPLLGDSMQQLNRIAVFNGFARYLSELFWPGGLTLVLPRVTSFPDHVAVGHKTIAVRIPDNSVPRAIARHLGCPITGTSANIHGRPSPLTAAEVRDQLGGLVDMILNGGRCRSGRESTMVDVSNAEPFVLRAGSISRDVITKAWDDFRCSRGNQADCSKP